MPDVGTSWFQALPVRWATPCARGQHPRSAAKATERAGKPGGAPAENLQKGCAEGEIDRSERSEQQRSPLANQAARTDLDRAGSHTER